MGKPRLDLSGKLFGELTAVKYLGVIGKSKTTLWECNCSCGNIKNVSTGHLQSGHTKSCGCKSYYKGEDHHIYTHGKSKSKVYKSWNRIKDRCNNAKCSAYYKYGAKGVIIAPEYVNNFELFYAEVGDPPSGKYSIDRIDHKVGYVKGNMRWATDSQQSQNRGKQKNNTSGVTGVRIFHSGNPEHSTYCIAIWKSLDGKDRNKSFNCSKLGLLPAFKAAFDYRNKVITELNISGAEYSYNHGI